MGIFDRMGTMETSETGNAIIMILIIIIIIAAVGFAIYCGGASCLLR